MQPNQINLEGLNGKVLISTLEDDRIRLEGTSVWTSVESGNDYHNSITVGPPAHGKEGVVALVLETSRFVRKGPPEHFYFFLRLCVEDGKVFIDKKREWSPPVGVKVCFASSHLQLIVDGEKFTTSVHGPALGMRLVSGDVICKFGNGEISADDVRAAASEIERKKSLEEELEQAKMFLGGLNIELDQEREKVRKLEGDEAVWLKKFQDTLNVVMEARKQVLFMIEDYEGEMFFPKKHIKKMIQRANEILSHKPHMGEMPKALFRKDL